MNTIFALQDLPKFIFLAGPTPRNDDVPSWRPEAIKLLETAGFEGSVLVPEQADWKSHDDYDGQITWEWEGLNLATVVLFWVPREMQTMPAFTTNVEFGLLAAQGKSILGYPHGSPKMKYLDALAKRFHMPTYSTLEACIEKSVAMTEAQFGTFGHP